MGGLFVKVLKSIFVLSAMFVVSGSVWAHSADIVTARRDCVAYITGDLSIAMTDEARALTLRKVDPQAAEKYKDCVESEDGIAIFENNGNKCTTKSCQGIVMNKKLACGGGKTGTNCKAIVLGKPEMCVDIVPEDQAVVKIK